MAFGVPGQQGQDLQEVQPPDGRRRRTSWRRRVALGLAGLVVAAGFQITAASPSSAAVTGYEMVHRAVVVPAGYNRVTVTCPAGKVVTGGGAHILDAVFRDQVTIQESGPAGSTGWTVALLLKRPDARNIAFYAACITPPFGYQVVRQDVAISGGGSWLSSKACPAGTTVLGGGALVADSGGGDAHTVIQGTFGLGPAWSSDVRNNDSRAHIISLYAVCGAIGNVSYVRHTAELAGWSIIGPGKTATVTRCPSAQLPLAGGALVDGGPGHHVDLQLNGPLDLPDRWGTLFAHWDAFITRTITVVVVCA